jgi:hypothetical protein
MAYYNCPYCPSQSFPVPADTFMELGNGLQMIRCISKHEAYVIKEKESVKEIVRER